MSNWMVNPAETGERNGVTVAAHYGNPQAEYSALTGGVAILDPGPVQFLRLKGSDVVGFLQGMTTQDVHGLKPGSAADSWFLDANGRIVMLTRLFRAETHEIIIQTPPDQAEALYRHLDHFLIMEDVTMKVMDEVRCLSIQGPDHQKALDAVQVAHMSHDRCGLEGADLLVPLDQATAVVEAVVGAGAVWAGADALDMARLEAFLPQYGVDMTPGQNPVLYGLGHRISNTKGCYVGQETVAMTRDRGRPPQLLVLLKGPGETPQAGLELLQEGKPVGVLSSTAHSPKHGTSLGMGLLKFKWAEAGTELQDQNGAVWTVHQVSNYKANEP